MGALLVLEALRSPLLMFDSAAPFIERGKRFVASAIEEISDRVEGGKEATVISYGVVRERSDSSSLASPPIVRELSDGTSADGGARIIEVNADAYSGDRIIVIDGDTIALPCSIPAPGCAEKIRPQGIDTPETFRPSCEAEHRAGLKAKERLVQLVRGSDVTVSRSGRDRYGRTLGDVQANGTDVGQILMSQGLALPYEPGSKAKATRIAHWCGRGDW